MKVFKWIASIALLCNTLPGFALNICDPCDPCNDMTYSVHADFLWWKVQRGALNISNSDAKYVNPDYHAGFRLGGRVHCDRWDLGVQWTSFDHDDSKDGEDYDVDYDVVDIEAGYTCCFDRCPGLSFRPFTGVKLAWIDEEFEEDEQEGDFKGYGLYIGAEGKLHLCDWEVCDRCIPISLIARASTGILDGEFKVEDDDDDRGDECLYVPVHELYLGLDFKFCDFWCGDADFQIGYEVQSWGSFRQMNSDDDQVNFGIGGLVARFGMTF